MRLIEANGALLREATQGKPRLEITSLFPWRVVIDNGTFFRFHRLMQIFTSTTVITCSHCCSTSRHLPLARRNEIAMEGYSNEPLTQKPRQREPQVRVPKESLAASSGAIVSSFACANSFQPTARRILAAALQTHVLGLHSNFEVECREC